MASARFQTNGVDLLIDGLLAAGETAGDIRERLWQVAWARGYQDVVVPLPVPDVKIEGFCVLTQEFSPQRTMVRDRRRRAAHRSVDKIEAPPLGVESADGPALRRLGDVGGEAARDARLRPADPLR